MKFYGSYTVVIETDTEIERLKKMNDLYDFLSENSTEYEIGGFEDTEKTWEY